MLLCQQVQRECDVEASSFALWQHKTLRHSSCFIRRDFAARNACQAIYQSPSNKSRVPALEISEAAITRSRYVTRSKLLHARACASSAVESVREREREILLSQDLLHRMFKAQNPPATSSLLLGPWLRLLGLHQVLVTDKETDQCVSYLLILAKRQFHRQASSPHLKNSCPSLMQHQQHRLSHLLSHHKMLPRGPGHPCNPSQLSSRSHMHQQTHKHQCDMLILRRASRAQMQLPLCSFG